MGHAIPLINGVCLIRHSYFLTLSAHFICCLHCLFMSSDSEKAWGMCQVCLWSGDGLILVVDVYCVELLLVDTNTKSHPLLPPAHPEHMCLALKQHCTSTTCHHFNQERPGMSKVIITEWWMHYKCWSLDPMGNYWSKGTCPTSKEESPTESRHCWRWWQPTTQLEESRNNDKAPGADGEVEGRALDSMDKLNMERIVFKGTGSLW